jgi:sulfoxide reductase heme-binding subunit YedZ
MAGVRYRGLDPDTRVARWIAFLVIAGVTITIFGGVASQAVWDWLTTEQDRLAWYGIRLLGILSWASLTGSVIYGLLLSTGILDAVAHRTVSFALHQELSAVGLGLALVHAALLTLDSSVPFSLTEVVVPFAAPYRPSWVGLGQLALYLTVVIVASFSMRKRLGQRTWRRLHYLTFLIAIAATLHGLMAGSDTGAPFALPMYAGATVAMVSLTAYRIQGAVLTRRGLSRAPGEASAPSTSPTTQQVAGRAR